jgi:hypothetical protein
VISYAARELAGRRLKRVSFSDERWVKIRGLTTKIAVFSVEPDGGDPRRTGG